MTGNNTKERHLQMLRYAVEHLELADDGGELLNAADVQRGMMDKFGCTRQTAWRNVQKAARRIRHNMAEGGLLDLSAWGGERPGAGRPSIRQQVESYIAETGAAHLELRNGVVGVVFHDEDEWIALNKLRYDSELGFHRLRQ